MAQVKEVVKDWKKNVRDQDKNDRTRFVYDELPDLVRFYLRKAHKEQDTVAQMFDMFKDKKFAKAIKEILKTDDYNPIEVSAATMLGDFLVTSGSDLDEKTLEIYSDAIKKILKKRTGKVVKKSGLDPDVAQELLLVIADPEIIGDPKFLYIYMQRLLKKLYAIARDRDLGLDSTDKFKGLFKVLFGGDMLPHVPVHILLEPKHIMGKFNENQISVWNGLTAFALEYLEKQAKDDKDGVRDALKSYTDRREFESNKGRDSARRINLQSLTEEDYPKLAKIISKVADKDKAKRFL